MDFGKMLIVFGIFMIIAGVAIGFSGKFFLVGAVAGGYSLVLGKDDVFLSCRLIFCDQYCRNNSFKSVF